jgi:uncharacterized repeat protein (TIGR03803 family)
MKCGLLAARVLSAIALVLVAGVPVAMGHSGPYEKVIHYFARDGNGFDPGPLTADAAGNLYGTTLGGGTGRCDCGTVYRLSPPATAGGEWTETILYSFQWSKTNIAEGEGPVGRVIFDKKGNLYGATEYGGIQNRGVIFELSPPSVEGEDWTESILYFFPRSGKRGLGGVSLDLGPDGDLYGLAGEGGTGTFCTGAYIPNKCGVAFVLQHPPEPGGTWTQHLLYEFGTAEGGSGYPNHFVFSPSGALYGITAFGGSSGYGTFFKLAKEQGKWTETTLYNFTGASDGGLPTGFVFDQAGNVFGTAARGGEGGCNCGVVFELLRPSVVGGAWTEFTLYAFSNSNDGYNPEGPLIFDKAGNLYGETVSGGDPTCQCGTIFQLSPPTTSGAEWSQTTLHAFLGHYVHGDGDSPMGLVFYKGKFFGTTYGGGRRRVGTVFSLVIVP